VVLKRALASFAVPRLARQLPLDKGSWAASALVRIAARPLQPAAGKAFDALVAATNDPLAAGNVLYQCMLQSGGREDKDDRVWSSVAGPVLLEGAPARLVRFLDQESVVGERWTRPAGIAEKLMMCVSFHSPRRPALEEFLSTTDQPLILAELASRWRDGTFLPNRIETDVTVANPHVIPFAGRENVLLAVAKDRLDLVDLTQPGTVDTVVRGTQFPRQDLADKYRRVLRALPPGAAQERVCQFVVSRLVGADEAKAAAVEAGYSPERQQDRAVFLFLSEQWDRYDETDPDGELLYAAYLAVHRSADLGAHGLTWSILDTARRNGRADPARRYLEENPLPKSRKPGRGHGPIGGYSSDYGTGGDHGGGGDYGGGWTGGSFHT
jgi:hypothetical protein